MTESIMLDQFNQLLLDFFLPYDFFELHCAVKIKTKAACLRRLRKFPFNPSGSCDRGSIQVLRYLFTHRVYLIVKYGN